MYHNWHGRDEVTCTMSYGFTTWPPIREGLTSPIPSSFQTLHEMLHVCHIVFLLYRELEAKLKNNDDSTLTLMSEIKGLQDQVAALQNSLVVSHQTITDTEEKCQQLQGVADFTLVGVE